MKKIVTILMAVLMLVSVIGCANNNGGSADEEVVVKVEGTLEEIMEKLYANLDPEQMPAVGSMPLTKDDIGYFTGVADLDFSEAMASEAMISAIAHSVVLVRMNEGADIEEAKKQIETNADPRKWVCVEAEKVIVDNLGDLVILIMSNEATADTIHASFQGLIEK